MIIGGDLCVQLHISKLMMTAINSKKANQELSMSQKVCSNDYCWKKEVTEVTEQMTEKLKKAERINGMKGNLKTVQILLEQV